MNQDQIKYYSDRAMEYEKIYEIPERQDEIRVLTNFLKKTFNNKSVLEIACGTGFWTQKVAEEATSVLATDVNQAVIEIAKSKKYLNPVKFDIANIFDLGTIEEKFDSCFGGFIWSHIPKQDLQLFLNEITSKVIEKGTIVFIDNQYVEGSSTPIASKDEFENTFQIRVLNDGSLHKVIKNFPTDSEIMKVLEQCGTDVEITRMKFFWTLTFRKK